MDAQLVDLLEELHHQGKQNDAKSDRAISYLNLDPQTANVIATLLRAMNAKRILEIGTSNGYSTLWLASAIQSNNGKVISIDRLPEKHAEASANLRRAGLESLVEFRCGDATQIVATLEGPFDAIFFDADRISAPAQLHSLLPKLAPRALILADNALSHPEEIAPYLAAVGGLKDFHHSIIPVGKGLSVAIRQ